ACSDYRRQVVGIDVALHVHVDAGLERQRTSHRGALGYTVRLQLFHRRPVADHEAAETPLVPQYRAEQPVIGGAWHATDLIEGRHDAPHARRDRGMEGRQVNLTE